jgi:predicted ATP-grasp superfamily ATP-dependent carboligase
MKDHTAFLSGKKIGVIGFNARPMAHSLKQIGAQTFVSDYWGDLDLKEVSSDCIAVLSPTPGIRQRQPIDIPVPQALVENFLLLTKRIDIDFVLIGSGFDDDSDALKPIEEREWLIGNSVDEMKNSRIHSRIDKIAESQGLEKPREFVTSTNKVESLLEKISYPCVARPLKSGGGSGIRLLRNPKNLQSYIEKRADEDAKFRIQEYISGFDISASILSSKSDAQCLSVQGQLIGMPTAGKNCGFSYCGNYYPTFIPKETVQQIAEASLAICDKLNLIGSNGLDFIVDKAHNIWLMEVNPRIQGTLEMLEKSGDISITAAHMQAINGELPDKIPVFRPVVKMIVYSRYDGAVPDLSKYSNVVDRTPEGVVVHRGDPICTIIEVGSSLKEAYGVASRIAGNIQSKIIKKQRSSSGS